MSEYASRYPDFRIRCLRNEVNLGANEARNRGVLESRGEIVAFIDSDCMADPDWLETLTKAISTARVAGVTGLVKDFPPTNIYELTFLGMHRLARKGPAHRVIGMNMAFRRELLLKYALDKDFADWPKTKEGRPDTIVSGRCDEEGVYLMLKAAGYAIVVEPGAVVHHEHHYSGSSFFRQAYVGGKAAAKLVYKYRLPPRLDMLPFLLAYGSLILLLPLIVTQSLTPGWLCISVLFFLGALTAITYNDLVRKGKSLGQTLRSFAMLVAYYHVRLWGYVIESVRLRTGRTHILRVDLKSIRVAGCESDHTA